jgi:streptomycin 6-kinase
MEALRRFSPGSGTALANFRRSTHPRYAHKPGLSGSGRGWLAIDPQGLLGDPAYDVANIFGNPDGAFPDIIHSDRIEALMALFAPLIGCSTDKILRYAIAHAGLSVSWAIQDGLPLDAGDPHERLSFIAVARSMLKRSAPSL